MRTLNPDAIRELAAFVEDALASANWPWRPDLSLILDGLYQLLELAQPRTPLEVLEAMWRASP